MGRKHEKVSGSEDGSGGEEQATAHWYTPEPFDASKSWRSRHHVLFLVYGIAAPSFNIIFVIYLCFFHFGLPTYVWGTCAALVALLTLYMALSVFLLWSHKFRTSKLNLGWGVLILWLISLGATMTPFVGAAQGTSPSSSATSTTDTATTSWTYDLPAGGLLAVLANLSTIVLLTVSYKFHILNLEDTRADDDEGLHHHFRRHFRRHKHKKHGGDDDDE